MSATGLILFGHGARDARWAEPMERIKDRLVAQRPQARVVVAFLEIMQPDLHTAAERLIGEGCERIAIVPVFLGQGGHVRHDLAALTDTLREKHPAVDIVCAVAVGEDDAVLDAVAAYCMRAVDGR